MTTTFGDDFERFRTGLTELDTIETARTTAIRQLVSAIAYKMDHDARLLAQTLVGEHAAPDATVETVDRHWVYERQRRHGVLGLVGMKHGHHHQHASVSHTTPIWRIGNYEERNQIGLTDTGQLVHYNAQTLERMGDVDPNDLVEWLENRHNSHTQPVVAFRVSELGILPYAVDLVPNQPVEQQPAVAEWQRLLFTVGSRVTGPTT